METDKVILQWTFSATSLRSQSEHWAISKSDFWNCQSTIYDCIDVYAPSPCKSSNSEVLRCFRMSEAAIRATAFRRKMFHFEIARTKRCRCSGWRHHRTCNCILSISEPLQCKNLSLRRRLATGRMAPVYIGGCGQWKGCIRAGTTQPTT